MSDRQKQLKAMWDAYQLGQGSADHTARQVFYGVAEQALDRIAQLEADMEIVEANAHAMVVEERKLREKAEAETAELRRALSDLEDKWFRTDKERLEARRRQTELWHQKEALQNTRNECKETLKSIMDSCDWDHARDLARDTWIILDAIDAALT